MSLTFSLLRECLKNGSAPPRTAFNTPLPVTASMVTVEAKKSARIYVEFQEMQDGGDAL